MAKKNTAATEAPVVAKPELTGNEVKILTALNKSKGPMTRQQLSKATGINKGWSRVLGAATKDDGGVAGKDSLEGRGLIASNKPEGERTIGYTITAKGRQKLAAAK